MDVLNIHDDIIQMEMEEQEQQVRIGDEISSEEDLIEE